MNGKFPPDSFSVNKYPVGTGSKFGLRDKYDQGSGLSQVNPRDVQTTVLENTIIIDTRDCIGEQSILDAQAVFYTKGGRKAASGTILGTSAVGIFPMIVTFNSTDNLKAGDTIFIKGIVGNTSANGITVLKSVGVGTGTIDVGTNANYISGGSWGRPADQGFPIVKYEDDRLIGNKIIIKLEKKLRKLRSISLYHMVIPRDIIPLEVYLKDFIPASIADYTRTYDDFGYVVNSYTTSIPQEKKYMQERMLGFYSTPLDLFRSYQYAAFSMQDAYTPPPLNIWNPSGAQPASYPFQTVPTYKTGDFNVVNQPGLFHIICSGYGVYDLKDWTLTTNLATDLLRKLVLLLLIQKQSYRDQDYVELIINSSTTTSGSTDAGTGFGYGNYQRFIPGPGIGQAYQPGTSDGADPTVHNADSPIFFPNFRGNVWGPYNRPGDRFQKFGLRSTVQDLYLNGDLSNLLGSPIILPRVPTEALTEDPIYGLNFSSLIQADLGNIDKSTNLNIINAMRITPNGYGAGSYRTDGDGGIHSNFFKSAGGQGPSNMGAPSAWVNTDTNGGTGSYIDPIAQGSSGPNLTVGTADASSTGDGGGLTYNAAFYDLGPNNGNFRTQIYNFIGYAVSDIPDTDLILKMEEAKKDLRSQSTNSFNSDAILDCPIRLSLGGTSGTLQYIESLQSLIAGASSYWEKRYLNPKASLDELHISLYTYEGNPIPIEKMLQTRRSLDFLNLFVQATADGGIDPDVFPIDSFIIAFLFDPLNPRLVGRVKRYIQIMFKAHSYETLSPGLEPDSFNGVPPGYPSQNDPVPWT
jgi:hypothetical protein